MTHTSREYAEALYALSEEEGRTEEYLSALSLTEETLAENPGFLMLLASPAISREERMNALEAALRDRIPLSMLTLMKLMVFRGHARELPRMMAAFRDQVREHRGESNAEVWSAVPLTDKEQQALRDKLEKRFGKKMILITDSASGLEIDKKDIRFVIHFNLPDSPENYYRQIICAGQDGHQASCILCYAGADDLIVSKELRQSSFVAELTSNELAEHIEQAKQSGTRASTELRKYILPKLRESIPSEERNERKNLKFTVWNDICENSNPVLLRKQKSCDKKHIYPRSFWCRLNIIVDFLNAHPEDSCVIYCTTKDYVNQVYKQLRYKRLPVTRYYASLDKDKKNKKSKESKKTNMAAFESGEKKIIVSTSALGMGIDKQDIRFVIHFNLPTCLEDYYQQAGRAGRDNAPARCILCYAGADDLEICRTLNNASTFRTELKGETLDIHKRIKEQRLEKMLLYGQMCFTLSNVRKPSVVLEKEIDRYFKEFEPIISSDELKTSKKNIRRIINRVDVLYVNRTKMRAWHSGRIPKAWVHTEKSGMSRP